MVFYFGNYGSNDSVMMTMVMITMMTTLMMMMMATKIMIVTMIMLMTGEIIVDTHSQKRL